MQLVHSAKYSRPSGSRTDSENWRMRSPSPNCSKRCRAFVVALLNTEVAISSVPFVKTAWYWPAARKKVGRVLLICECRLRSR